MTGNRAFYIYTVLFALGTACAQLSPVSVPAWLTISGGLVLVPCALVRPLRPAVVCLAGVAWALFRADLVLAVQWPRALEGRDVTIVGKIAGLPQRGRHYLKFDLDVEHAERGGRVVSFDGRIRLRWYSPPWYAVAQVKAGTRWRLVVRLKRPHGYYNPGGFDYEGYLFRRGIRATGYVRRSGVDSRLSPAGLSLGSLRQALKDRLDLGLTGLRHAGLLRALAIGDRSTISEAEWHTLRATGTSHLISISGLHIGFAAGIGVFLGVWLGRFAGLFARGVAAPRIGALGGLCFATAYAALSGFNVPAQRALVMALVFLFGVLCRRHSWNMRGLCLALIAVLVINPASVHDAGFWLSFCAVAFILAWIARANRRQQAARIPDVRSAEPLTWRDRAAETVKLQWMLSLALLPLVALFFGRVSTVSAPANMLAVPVVMFCIVPPCLLGTVAVTFGWEGVASLCLRIADRVADLLWAALTWLGQLHYSSLPLHLELWQAFVLMAGAAWIVLVRPRRRAWGAVCLVALLAPAPAGPARGEVRLAVLDVGEGLAVVVRTRHHTLLYGTGPSYPGGFSLSRAVVIPYLRSRSVRTIDTLIVPDGRRRNGMDDLRTAFRLRRVLAGHIRRLPGVLSCGGRHWRWDGVTFRILDLSPGSGDGGCVLKVTGRYGSLLLTGDIQAAEERALQRRWSGALHSDVLLVPHHGGTGASTLPFITRVAPSWAIVSAGYLNRYGHPRPEVMSRYRTHGIRTITTGFAGAVIVDLSRDGIRVQGWRARRPRYWLTRR
ncbi:MAG: DNA internalization-related competence protein ComEC/Rec2 [Arenicellales bacterium]